MPSYNDLPEMMAEILERQKSLESQLHRLTKATAEKADKGEMLSGYRAMMKHYQVTQTTIQQWITEGAPIYKKGNTHFCYANEMDSFLQKNNPFFKN